MNADIFAEWQRRQGNRVERTESSYWVEAGPRIFQAFPYHWIIEPLQSELDGFLKGKKGIGLRYSTPLNVDKGTISYHAVFEEAEYQIEKLGKWARKNVLRGLKNCTIEPITFESLAEKGWGLQKDTLERQGRQSNISHAIWQNLCLSAANLPGFEAWGAFVNSQLAASVLSFQMENCGYMLYQQCRREYLAEHVNNALSFRVSEELMKRSSIHSILYGLHSLDAPASVDEFKFRMGYSAKPVRQRVVFHPRIMPLFNSATYGEICRLHNLAPGNHLLAKAEGMVRFYLQGKLPLEKQTWPEALVDRKSEILAGLIQSESAFI